MVSREFSHSQRTQNQNPNFSPSVHVQGSSIPCPYRDLPPFLTHRRALTSTPWDISLECDSHQAGTCLKEGAADPCIRQPVNPSIRPCARQGGCHGSGISILGKEYTTMAREKEREIRICIALHSLPALYLCL